jgi:hypothetical protein
MAGASPATTKRGEWWRILNPHLTLKLDWFGEKRDFSAAEPAQVMNEGGTLRGMSDSTCVELFREPILTNFGR